MCACVCLCVSKEQDKEPERGKKGKTEQVSWSSFHLHMYNHLHLLIFTLQQITQTAWLLPAQHTDMAYNTHTLTHTQTERSCHSTHMRLALPLRKHGLAPVINNNGIGYMTCWVMGPLSELIYMALCSNHRPPNVALSKWAFRNIVQFIASQLAPGGRSINHARTHAPNDS